MDYEPDYPRYDPEPDEMSWRYSDEWRDECGPDVDDVDEDPEPIVGLTVDVRMPAGFVTFPAGSHRRARVVALQGSRHVRVRFADTGAVSTVDVDHIVASWWDVGA